MSPLSSSRGRGLSVLEVRIEKCIAFRYAYCMAQFVTRIDTDLEQQVDALIAEGIVESRSDAVRRGLGILIDQHRRQKTARQIVAGYKRQPQGPDESGWGDRATLQMIAEEPW